MKFFKAIGHILFYGLMLILIAAIGFGGYQAYKTNQRVHDVERWESTVKEVTAEYNLSAYNDIVMAIILTESKGEHLDVMQSSESQYGTTDLVTSSRESIEIGVKHLSEVLKEAQDKGTDIWTGVQAYNFGSNYIEYVRKNGGIHSVELAEKYSRDVLAPLLGNNFGQTYRYLKPRAIAHNGGYLYKDGGNFFYAETVEWNLRMMKIFQDLPF